MSSMGTTVTFDSIKIGDQVPAFEIGETQETIDGARNPDRIADSAPRNIHNDPEFAKSGIFGVTVNGGVTTMAYITQMLERWFPASAFYNGGSLTYKGIAPFRPGDVVTFTGSVTGKRTVDGQNLVDIEIKGVDQGGRLVGVAEATLAPEN